MGMYCLYMIQGAGRVTTSQVRVAGSLNRKMEIWNKAGGSANNFTS